MVIFQSSGCYRMHKWGQLIQDAKYAMALAEVPRASKKP